MKTLLSVIATASLIHFSSGTYSQLGLQINRHAIEDFITTAAKAVVSTVGTTPVEAPVSGMSGLTLTNTMCTPDASALSTQVTLNATSNTITTMIDGIAVKCHGDFSYQANLGIFGSTISNTWDLTVRRMVAYMTVKLTT